MSRIVGVRLGTELQAKLDTLCEDTQQIYVAKTDWRVRRGWRALAMLPTQTCG